MNHSINPDRLPLVFVTGNANKLREVKAILSKGEHTIEISSQNIDSKITRRSQP